MANSKVEKLLERYVMPKSASSIPGLDYENPDPDKPKGSLSLTWEDRRKYSAETGDYPPVEDQTEYCNRVRMWKDGTKTSNRTRNSDKDDPTEY